MSLESKQQQYHQQPKFCCDISLFRFAKQLRLLGCDVLCDETIKFQRLILSAQAENRILLVSQGKLIPMLYKRHCLISDLTNGKAFSALDEQNQKTTTKKQQQQQKQHQQIPEQQRKQKLEKKVKGDSDDDDENSEKNFDPRKFHTVREKKVVEQKNEEHVNQTSSSSSSVSSAVAVTRRRRLIGYNEDGDSEYEYEDEFLGTKMNKNSVSPSSKQQQQQQQNLSSYHDTKINYLVIDIHANFKVMLGEVIKITNIGWFPDILFTRCVKDNSVIEKVSNKNTVEKDVPPGIYRVYQNFYRCPGCQQCYWGVDDAVTMNTRSARTIDYLRSLFDGQSLDSTGHLQQQQQQKISSSTTNCWGQMRRHIFSFSRKIKIRIFSFLLEEELDSLVIACPLFKELVEMKRMNLDLSFVPERVRGGKINPKYAPFEEKQQVARAKAASAAASASAVAKS